MKHVELLGILAFVTACGGASSVATAPAAPPPPASARDARPTLTASRAPSPVPDSSVRYLMGLRFAHPESTLRTVVATFSQYMPPMARDVRGLVEMAVGYPVTELLALDRPIDVRIFERGEKQAVVLTATLRDGVDVRATLGRFRMTEMPDGLLHIMPPHPFNSELAVSKECEIDLAAQPRTISCSNGEDLLAQARAQRSSRAASSDEVSIEMGVDLVKQTLAKQELVENSRTTEGGDEGKAAGRALGPAFYKSMALDLKSLELATNLSQDGVTADLNFRWLAGSSLFARALGSSSASGAPPARFLHLPVDSDAAFFSYGVDAGVWEPVKKQFVESALESVTSKTDYPASIVTEGRSWLNRLVFTGGPWMFAIGRRPGDVRDRLKSPAVERLASDERKIDLAHAAKQWAILEIEEPGNEVVARAKELVDFSRRADLLGKSKPEAASKSTAPKSDDDKRREKLDIGAAPRSLPAATFHLVNRSVRVDQPKNAKLVETSHIFVVPEGDHAWIGYGDDEKTIAEHLKRVLEGQPKSGTLAARPGIEVLSKTAPLAAGGFFSLSALLGLAGDFVDTEPSALKDKLDYVASAPSKGAAPYFIAIRRGPDGSPQTTIEAKTSIRSLDEFIGYVQRFDSK